MNDYKAEGDLYHMANLLDGKSLAAQIQANIKHEIASLVSAGKRPPGLAVIMIGHDLASAIYVKNKRLACEQVGIYSEAYDLPHNTTQEALLILIETLNQSAKIDGILVQLPLPSPVHSDLILEKINPYKDVDGFHPYNMGRLAQQNPLLRPCTPLGVMVLLEHYHLPVAGQHVVIVGASNIVGKPMAFEMLMAGATVTICHRHTNNLAQFIQTADILVSATGNPDLIQPDWLQPHAIVIDIGIVRTETGQIRGDIPFATVSKKVRWITPVPGGVGPMTVAMLMRNTLEAYQRNNS